MLGKSINNKVYRHIMHEPRRRSFFAIKLKRNFQFGEILCDSEFHGSLNRFLGGHDAASGSIDNNRKLVRKNVVALSLQACQQFSNRFLISTSKFVNENEFHGFKAHASPTLLCFVTLHKYLHSTFPCRLHCCC